MIVKVMLNVLVDPEEWAEEYGMSDDSSDAVAQSVTEWVENAVSNHPTGLLANSFYTQAEADAAFEDGAVL